MASESRRRVAPPWKRLAAHVHWLLFSVALLDWSLLRAGTLRHSPSILAAIVALAMLALVARAAVVMIATGRGRWAAAGEALLLTGILLALGAGLVNWLFAAQGFVIVHEGEAIPLTHGSHLSAFSHGPLARLDELELTVFLRELELVPAGDGAFHPRSRLRIDRPDREPLELEVDTARFATIDRLRLHQGAFGFAPRIVLLRGDETVFDRVVPFRSRRSGASGVAFSERFTIAEAGLDVAGRVELDSVDPQVPGHAELEVDIRQADELLGRGRLELGHFAEVRDGYRVGFAGLKKWSEVDVSRNVGSRWIRVGGWLSLAGAVLWPLLAWRFR